MTWLGQAAFRLRDERETRAAMLVAGAFDADADARARWLKMDRLYAYLVGPADDLTPEEYAGIWRKVRGKADAFERFRKEAAGLRDPAINSMVLAPEDAANWLALTKGMRFLGPRYVPDSALFMEVAWPKVKERVFPSGLDVLAACGVARARKMAEAGPGADDPAYRAGLERGGKRMQELRKAAPRSHYVEFLDVMEAMASPPPAQAAPFVRTDAYADKSIMSALAAWASMRHAWQLWAKAECWCLGGASPPVFPGYVEPNPTFFKAMGRLAQRTRENLAQVEGVQIKRLREFERLVDSLAAMVEKQAARRALSKEEIGLLHGYGETIACLQGFNMNLPADEGLQWMSLVADVHTEALVHRQCLEVATGGAMPIYVVVETGTGPQLCKGAVYSYYEFLQPMEERLTDEAWRGLCESGRLPPMPAWAGSFVAGYDVESLLARAAKGERVPELLSLSDPRVDEFFRGVVRPGGPFDGRPDYEWALRAAARRLGREVAPALLDRVRLAPVEEKKPEPGASYLEGPASSAACAFALVARGEDLPALEAMVFGPDRSRALLAVAVVGGVRDKAAEKLLAKVIAEAKDPVLRERALNAIGDRGSKDVTPVLLAAWQRADTKDKVRILEALACVWGWGAELRQDVYPTQADDAAVLGWRRQVAEIVTGILEAPRPVSPSPGTAAIFWRPGEPEIDDSPQRLWDLARSVAAEMRLPAFLAIVRKELASGDLLYESDAEQLVRMRSAEATELLLSVSADKEPGVRIVAAWGLARSTDPAARRRLAELLADMAILIEAEPAMKQEAWLVCDRVAEILAGVYPGGPGFDESEMRATRDSRLARWKSYIQQKDLPAPEDLR